MYNSIIDPSTKDIVFLYSDQGYKILHKYINNFIKNYKKKKKKKKKKKQKTYKRTSNNKFRIPDSFHLPYPTANKSTISDSFHLPYPTANKSTISNEFILPTPLSKNNKSNTFDKLNNPLNSDCNCSESCCSESCSESCCSESCSESCCSESCSESCSEQSSSISLKGQNPNVPLHGTVAVVGNGPIAESDFDNIKKCDFIVQFNNAAHYDKLERCDVLAIRPLERLRNKLLHVQPILAKLPADVLVLPVVVSSKRVELFRDRPHTVLPPVLVHQRKSGSDIPGTTTLFECSEKKCQHLSSRNGPSTGAAVLSFLDTIEAIDSLEVFGMNFSGRRWSHLDFRDPSIVSTYCKKCTIHATSTPRYRD